MKPIKLFCCGTGNMGTHLDIISYLYSFTLFWTILEVDYRKLLFVQLIITMIFLIEKLVFIPVHLFLGISAESNIFSLGIIAQTFTSIELIIFFLANITLFKVWAIILTYKYYRHLSERSPRFIIWTLIGFYLFVAVISSLLSYIKFENII